MYEISDNQFDMACDLGVEILPSENKRKLIDVYKDGVLYCSVGAINFRYYRELLRDDGAWEANQKKQKILARYKNNCRLEVLYMIRFLWCCY